MSEKKDTFCVLPFIEFNLNASGAMKPCCAYGKTIQRDGRPMSVYEHSVDEIWNSADLRETRRKLIAGEVEPACRYCTRMEDQKLRPLRIDANEMWRDNVVYNPARETIEQLMERAVKNDYAMGDGGIMLNLDVGNLCNLKCRMCHAQFSSMITSDPVHSKWSFVAATVARWRGTSLRVAPRAVIGVGYPGFGGLDRSGSTEVIIGHGDSHIAMDRVPNAAKSVYVKLASATEGQPLTLKLNGTVVFDEPLPSGSWEKEFDLVGVEPGGVLDLHFLSPQSHIAVEEVSLRRETRGANQVAFSRFPTGEQWFQNRDFLLGELLKNAANIRQVNLIGGEPMLIDQCFEVVRHLVEHDVAKDMVLSVTTNGMVIPEGWLELASKFRQVTLTISLDGYGPVSEYIRFPSKWDQIQANIERYKSLKNAFLLVNVTVQTYNMLHIPDLIRYCDGMGLEFRYHFLIGPEHLSPLVMPAPIRAEAGQRIRQFAMRNDKSEATRTTHVKDRDAWLLQLAEAFEADVPNWDTKKLREFMIFTNDLDASRGQNFATALPELAQLLRESGHEWIADRRYAG